MWLWSTYFTYFRFSLLGFSILYLYYCSNHICFYRPPSRGIYLSLGKEQTRFRRSLCFTDLWFFQILCEYVYPIQRACMNVLVKYCYFYNNLSFFYSVSHLPPKKKESLKMSFCFLLFNIAWLAMVLILSLGSFSCWKEWLWLNFSGLAHSHISTSQLLQGLSSASILHFISAVQLGVEPIEPICLGNKCNTVMVCKMSCYYKGKSSR